MNDQKTNWSQLLSEAVTKSGKLSNCYEAFHGYSFGNQMLAMFQCEARGLSVGPIATFQRWKELGRNVKKGSKAISLCMPVTIKDKADPEAKKTIFVYKNNWFVLDQTDGAEFVPPALPAFDIDAALQALEIERVPFTHTDGNSQGYAQNRNVAINPVAQHPTRTLFHEIAHVVLGHTLESTSNDSGELTPRDIRELEAEATSYLVSASLGISSETEQSHSRAYIKHWYESNEVPEASAKRIFAATDKILKAGRKSEEKTCE